jgi:hypothetical protein
VIPVVYELVDRKADAYYVERRARKDNRAEGEADVPAHDLAESHS